MDEHHRSKLKDNLSLLSGLIDGFPLIDALLGNGVISKDMHEVQKECLGADRKQGMCSVIMQVTKRGPRAYELFLEALIETSHFDAVMVLEPDWTPAKLNTTAHDLQLRKNLKRSSLSSPNFSRDRTFSAPAPFRLQQLVHNFSSEPSEELDTRSFGPEGPTIPQGDENAASANITLPNLKGAVIYNNGAVKNVYPMTRNPRGYVLLINNEEFQFEEMLSRRVGSRYDCSVIKHLFEKLYFVVEDHHNKAYQDMKRIIIDFATSDKHDAVDACFVVIMSHGNNEKGRDFVYSYDHKEIEAEWIHTQFNNENAPKLYGKPKVFLYQCCRGDLPDSGTLRPMTVAMPRVRTETDGFPDYSAQANGWGRRIPTFSDMLIAHASVPGYASFRDTEWGTWFIQTLCRVIAEEAADKDFRDILDETGRRMCDLESSAGEKQAPEVKTRLFMKMYLNPGLYMNAEDEVGGVVMNFPLQEA